MRACIRSPGLFPSGTSTGSGPCGPDIHSHRFCGISSGKLKDNSKGIVASVRKLFVFAACAPRPRRNSDAGGVASLSKVLPDVVAATKAETAFVTSPKGSQLLLVFFFWLFFF